MEEGAGQGQGHDGRPAAGPGAGHRPAEPHHADSEGPAGEPGGRAGARGGPASLPARLETWNDLTCNSGFGPLGEHS